MRRPRVIRTALMSASAMLLGIDSGRLGGAGRCSSRRLFGELRVCRRSGRVASGPTSTITNVGDAVSSWALTWSYDAGQTVTQAWNTTLTQSGAAVTAKNVSYNGGHRDQRDGVVRLQRLVDRQQPCIRPTSR